METLGVILLVLLSGIALFQLLLALGLPFGEAAWGGQNPGVLPKKYRIGSAVSFLVFLFLITVVLSKTQNVDLYSESVENLFMWVATAFFGLSILMNAASKSKLEKLWAPYAGAMFILSLMIVMQ